MFLIQRDLDPTRNPFFFKYGVAREIIVREGRTALARVVAISNPRLVRAESTGLLGFYQSADHEEANHFLFEAAGRFLRSRGHLKMAGPINFSTWYQNRFMVRGFERESFPGEPRNPAFYPLLWEQCGFQVGARYFTARHPHLKEESDPNYARLNRSLEIFNQKGYRFEAIHQGDVETRLTELHAIMQDIFQQNHYFAAVDFDEFRSIFLPLCRPGSPGQIIVSLTPSGRVSGGLVNLDCPENPATHIVKSIGVSPQERLAANAHALIARAVNLGKEAGCRWTDSALMHEENMSRRIAMKLGGEIIKEYAIFERDL